jgi:hypothetical protein
VFQVCPTVTVSPTTVQSVLPPVYHRDIYRMIWTVSIIQANHHHSAACLSTGPSPLPKPVLHTVRSSSSSFNLLYYIASLSSRLRLLPHLSVTYSLPSPFPKPVLHAVRSSASSFNLQYFIASLSTLSSRLRVLPHLSVTSILPSPLPKRVLHAVRSSASSFNLQYPLFSVRSASSCLRLLTRLPVTSILPFNSPKITRFRRQFLRKM